MKRVRVTVNCESTNHGAVRVGEREFPEAFANHLIEIGNAVAIGGDKDAGKEDKREKDTGKETKPAKEEKKETKGAKDKAPAADKSQAEKK